MDDRFLFSTGREAKIPRNLPTILLVALSSATITFLPNPRSQTTDQAAHTGRALQNTLRNTPGIKHQIRRLSTRAETEKNTEKERQRERDTPDH